MMTAGWLGIAAGVTGVISYGPYLLGMRRQTTRPERTAWLILAGVYLNQFLAQAARGAAGSLWLTGAEAACVLVVCVLALRYGTSTRVRFRAPLIAAVSIALAGYWLVTKDAAAAIILASGVECVAVSLVVVKTWREGLESRLSWLLCSLAGALGLAAVGHHDPILYVYPASLVLMGVSVTAASLLWARRVLRQVPPAALGPERAWLLPGCFPGLFAAMLAAPEPPELLRRAGAAPVRRRPRLAPRSDFTLMAAPTFPGER